MRGYRLLQGAIDKAVQQSEFFFEKGTGNGAQTVADLEVAAYACYYRDFMRFYKHLFQCDHCAACGKTVVQVERIFRLHNTPSVRLQL